MSKTEGYSKVAGSIETSEDNDSSSPEEKTLVRKNVDKEVQHYDASDLEGQAYQVSPKGVSGVLKTMKVKTSADAKRRPKDPWKRRCLVLAAFLSLSFLTALVIAMDERSRNRSNEIESTDSGSTLNPQEDGENSLTGIAKYTTSTR